MLGMILVLLFFSFLSYYTFQNEVIKNEYSANKKILNQIKFNINYMDDMLVSLCFSLYYNPNIRRLKDGVNIDFTEAARDIDTVKTSIVNTNPFIHSIYIYNGQNRTYYTTLSDGIIFEDASLDELIKSYKEVPKLVPLYRKMTYTRKSVATTKNVCTYFIYDFTLSDGRMNGAVIINCDADWLLKNIRELNMVEENRLDKIFIMDNRGKFIGSSGNDEFGDLLEMNYKNYIRAGEDNTWGIFDRVIDGKKYLITYMDADNGKWVLIKTQPYDEVFKSVRQMKNNFILITLAFIVFSFIFTFKISRSIYHPIGKLVRLLKTGNIPVDSQKEVDEISFLNEVYNYSLAQLDQYKAEKTSDKGIMKNYFLRELLTDSYSVSKDEFEAMRKEKGVALSSEEAFAVCVIKIDDYAGYTEKYNNKDKDLYRFAIINIVSETLSGAYASEAVDLKSDQMIIIMNAGNGEEDMLHKMEEMIKQAQEIIFNHFKITVSVSVSGCSHDVKELTRLYKEALDISMYRFVLGDGCIITRNRVSMNIKNGEAGFKAVLERKLAQEIKVGNIEYIKETLGDIFEEIAKLNYSNIILALLQLINTVKAAVDELNAQRVEPVFVNFNLLSAELLEMQTLDRLQSQIITLLTVVVNRTGAVENEKQLALAEAVKDIIHANYFDSGLYLPQISSKLNMSSKHTARVFKAVTKMSVTDYLNEVRMNKAVEWLENSRFSIHEIIPKIGIDNESYFYKLFKMKFGVTPREYTLNLASKKYG